MKFLFYLLCVIVLINALILVVFGSLWLLNWMICDWFGVDIAQSIIERLKHGRV